jgi:hypothetical protein
MIRTDFAPLQRLPAPWTCKRHSVMCLLHQLATISSNHDTLTAESYNSEQQQQQQQVIFPNSQQAAYEPAYSFPITTSRRTWAIASSRMHGIDYQAACKLQVAIPCANSNLATSSKHDTLCVRMLTAELSKAVLLLLNVRQDNVYYPARNRFHETAIFLAMCRLHDQPLAAYAYDIGTSKCIPLTLMQVLEDLDCERAFDYRSLIVPSCYGGGFFDSKAEVSCGSCVTSSNRSLLI